MKKLNIPKENEMAYLKTLLYIASVDKTLSEQELNFFSIEGINVGLSESEIGSAIDWIKTKKVSLECVLQDITCDETKTALISKLLELCFSDGNYSAFERSGIIDVCILLDFDMEELKKLESKAELNFKLKKKSQQMKAAGDSVLGNVSKAFVAGKKGTEELGKHVVDGSAAFSHLVVSGIGAVGSKLTLAFENAKKTKEENKELRERLKKDSITEAVKQKVVLQLHSKMQVLAGQLKEEKTRNEQNERMILLLQEQIADLERTIVVAENVKVA